MVVIFRALHNLTINKKKLKSVGMTLAKVKEQDRIMLAKVKEQDGMMLAKVKEQDGMMLAKVKEQDGIMLANVKVPSIPTSAACCDDVQLTKLMRNPFPTPFTTVNYFIGLHPPNTATCSLFTTVNYFIGLCPPKTDTSIFIYNRQLLHRTASSFKPLM